MGETVHIRRMRHADISFAAGCTAAEGWASETGTEFEGFLNYDPGGCFIAEKEDERVGMCVATGYGESAFVGELIVVQAWRGCGIGRRLLEHAIEYLHRQGAQHILLDGVRRAVPLYERVGFRKLACSLRFTARMEGQPHAAVHAMQHAHLHAVTVLDRAAFGADRAFFLERRLHLYPELCKVLECDGEVVGFIMGRRGQNLISAGPWVMQPGVERPERLLESLAAEVPDLPIGIGVLETNTAAVQIIRSCGFVARSNPPWRMLLGRSGYLGASHQLYAVGSAAKG